MKRLFTLLILTTSAVSLMPAALADPWKDESGNRHKTVAKWHGDRGRDVERYYERQRELAERQREWDEKRREAARELEKDRRKAAERYYERQRELAEREQEWREDHAYEYRYQGARSQYSPAYPQAYYQEGPQYYDDGRQYYLHEGEPYYAPQAPQGGYYRHGTYYRAPEYVTPQAYYVAPGYSNRGVTVGARIGGRIGAAIAGAQGAAIGQQLGAEIGAEVDRAERY